MKRLTLVVLLTGMVIAGAAGAASPALAQPLSDAQRAFQGAKAAYGDSHFSEARDLAQKASETDPKNPDVFLLLGKAHYQLGELDEAMTAWKQTLALAPQESYAKTMLEVLQSRRKDVDARIRSVESLAADKLDAVAAVECRSLLDGSKPLTDAQRAAVLTLQADLAVRANQPAEARTILSNLMALYPKQADPIKTKLILGQAKLRSGGEATAEGLALLKELAGQGDAPAAATAQWELIAFDLNQGINAPRTAALAKWLSDHPKHFRADDARGQLLGAYPTLSDQAAPPRQDASLSDADLAALAVADEIIKLSPRSEDQAAAVQRVSQHLATRYTAHQANSAAAAGLRKLLTSPLPRASRVAVQLDLFQQLKTIAIKHLEDESASGRLFHRRPHRPAQGTDRGPGRPRYGPARRSCFRALDHHGPTGRRSAGVQQRAALPVLARSGRGAAGTGRLGSGHCPADSESRRRPRGGQDRGQPNAKPGPGIPVAGAAGNLGTGPEP